MVGGSLGGPVGHYAFCTPQFTHAMANTPDTNPPPLAHSGGHLLATHLHKVAELAQTFARVFGPAGAEWAYLAGLWHDLGKYRPGFQRYLALSNSEDAHIEGRVAGREKTHSIAGALWALQSFKASHGKGGELAARTLGYLIASHHAGLYDWEGGLKVRLADPDSHTELVEACNAAPPADVLDAGGFAPSLTGLPGAINGYALWVRLMFSCLVDADFLDTEAHFDGTKPQTRQGFPSLVAMLDAFDAFMAVKAAEAKPSAVNTLRADILRQCREKAALPPGFFSLTVPTGGGKTLSSLAFALRHAQQAAPGVVRRIVYAIPYTSIIEQTADQFRKALAALGDEVLIEHHSQAESDDKQETARSRLACENWDAPLIVTTNVQLFESMFAAKTSRCRKLHRLVNSVIVLDEAQQLPPEFLQPILDTLKLLVAHYGVTVVFCTATQPALTKTEYFDKSKGLDGIADVREIIDDPDALYRQLDRVQVELPADWNSQTPWPDLAERIAQEDCVLAIVGTRKAARTLHSLLPEGALHLSALMCGAHRSDEIEKIKQRLEARRNGTDTRPLRVVATNLVEAGVDLDFPVVYRALAGLDSIAQAAGRCNREGRLEGKGRVVVFIPPEKPPKGLPAQGTAVCTSLLHDRPENPLERGLFEQYFKRLYYDCDLDAKGIRKLLTADRELAVNFRTAAELFQLIDDRDSALVVVRYEPRRADIETLLATLVSKGPERWLMRKLQRLTVSIPQRDASRMLAQGSLAVTSVPGLYMQADAAGLYHPALGLQTEDVPYNPNMVY
jgi:CRISPR-associated endonuclease/helicase Cas3